MSHFFSARNPLALDLLLNFCHVAEKHSADLLADVRDCASDPFAILPMLH